MIKIEREVMGCFYFKSKFVVKLNAKNTFFITSRKTSKYRQN